MLKSITYDDTLWQLVPKEPNVEQQEAMVDAYFDTRDVVAAYRAGLSAAPTPPAQPTDAEFEVWQCDEMCASTSGPREDALREAMHYATVYSLDGPAKVYEVTRVEVNAEKE